MEADLTRPSYGALTRFFLPLALINFAQSVTNPLVASVISRGPLGGLEYEAYAIGEQVNTFLAATNVGLLTTGIVLATTRRANRNFVRLVLMLAAVAAMSQFLVSRPMAEHPIFERILAVKDAALRTAAQSAMLLGIPLQVNFFIRCIYQAHLFRARRSDLANAATLIRVALTFAISRWFTHIGLAGYKWGMVAFSLPCFAETALNWWFARRFLAALPETSPNGAPPASIIGQLRFSIPLSVGSVLLAATSFILIHSYSRSCDPELFLFIHFVSYGLAAIFLSAAQQTQTVAVVFADARERASRVLRFSLSVGAGLGAILFALSFCGPFTRWYFYAFQKVPPESLRFAAMAVRVGALISLLFALRGFVEGVAAVRFRTRAVLAGQVAYVFAFWLAFAACHALLAGHDHLWGMAATAAATALSAAATYLASGKLTPAANADRDFAKASNWKHEA
jgi:hypothetical protein